MVPSPLHLGHAPVELKLNRLDTVRSVIQFSVSLLKKLMVLQSANLIIALILFPIIGHYLNFLIPGLKITAHNLWDYQKAVLIIGSLSGLFLAILSSAKMTIRH